VSEQHDPDQWLRLLEEIRDNQRLQLERQAEALALQREQYEIVKQQFNRAESIQKRAEVIQEKSAQLVEKSRKAFMIILPVIGVLIAILAFLMVW
jgi:hypothetical protein